jgi:hypothetical protein
LWSQFFTSTIHCSSNCGKKAEEKYEFKQKGLITIPCKIEDFRKVQQSIDMEKSHHRHHAWCFKVWWASILLLDWAYYDMYMTTTTLYFFFLIRFLQWCWYNLVTKILLDLDFWIMFGYNWLILVEFFL